MFKRILVEGEKFKLRKLPSKDFIALLSSQRRACPVLKHNRVSEVFKGSKVYDFEYYGQRNYVLKWKFNLRYYKFVIYFWLYKIIRNPTQICDRCSLEYFAMLSRFHSRGPTHDFGSVTRIAFNYKLTGFRTIFFQKWFLCPLFCVCIFITVGLSTVARQLAAQASLQWDYDE